MLAVPLLREGRRIGAIRNSSHWKFVPFTDKQIALLKTFADQAVIAIENVRLFKELQERNSNCGGTGASDGNEPRCSGIISRSPTDVQPVLDAIVESAARVCGIDDVHAATPRRERYDSAGSLLVPYPLAASRSVLMSHSIRWMREHGTLHVPDVRGAERISRMIGFHQSAIRTYLAVPLRQQGELIGI